MHQIKRTLPVAPIGGVDFYNAIRAAFVSRGSSLNAWCREHGVNRQTAEKALKGERYSKRAHLLRQRLANELLELPQCGNS